MNFGIVTASSTDLLAQAVSVFTGLWPIILLVIGIPLGFYLIKKIISLIPKK